VGLAQRAEAKIKVRQPLAGAVVPKLGDAYKGIIAAELNVKEVAWGKDVKLDTKVTPELKAEGLMRDVVRHIQNARKEAGLEVDDRIVLTLESDSKDLAAAIAAHADTIKAETLATELKTSGASGGVPVRVDGQELFISVTKEA
jgi:isoleucyl-tRNA synthetase